MKIGEDTLFVMQYLQRVADLRVINKDVYVYHVPNNFIVKYNLDIENSIYCLNRIYLSYQGLKYVRKYLKEEFFLTISCFVKGIFIKMLILGTRTKE